MPTSLYWSRAGIGLLLCTLLMVQSRYAGADQQQPKFAGKERAPRRRLDEPVPPTPAPSPLPTAAPTPSPTPQPTPSPTTEAPSLAPSTSQAPSADPTHINPYGNPDPEEGPWPECIGWEGEDCRNYIQIETPDTPLIRIVKPSTGEENRNRVVVYTNTQGQVIRVPQRG